MALLLRLISKPKWVRPSWMDESDVPADVLTDLRAEKNELSVWRVTPDHSNVSSILTALASQRQRLDKLDFTIFDDSVLDGIGIRCKPSEGDTPHITANVTLHADLIELTVRKVALLAEVLMPFERERKSRKEVQHLLIDALTSGALDRNRMDAKLLSELEEPH